MTFQVLLFPMKQQKKNILNAQLINSQNSDYLMYCRYMTLKKKLHKTKEKTIKDQTIFVSHWLEKTILSAIEKKINIHPNNILQWDALENNKFNRRYKELDGVFNLTKNSVTVIEIKASQSKSSLTRGIKQLSSTNLILNAKFEKVITALIAADCRSLCSIFGDAELNLIQKIAEENNFIILQDLNLISEMKYGFNYLYLLDSDSILTLTEKYGLPFFKK